MITQYSEEYGVSGRLMTQIINCESQGNVSAVGDHGTSFGLVQIHLSAHPNITKQQAFDAEYSIQFLARELSLKHGDSWTCYRIVTSVPQ